MTSPDRPRIDVRDGRTRALLGKTLCGKWRVVDVLGIGGMSAVYKAVHRNGRVVALKVLAPALAQNARARRRFLREGLLANQVKHPGAVSVLDDDVAEDGTVFLIMDYVEGQTLHDMLRRRGEPLNLGLVMDVADKVLDILAAAHRQGIIHRDVKPHNIVRSATGQVRLLDFGIAQRRDTARPCDETGNVVLGTPAFMAPEQIRGDADGIDPRTDVWAVGATLFTLLTGRWVFEGRASGGLDACPSQPAPSVELFAPGLPSAVVNLVNRALQTDKTDRWPSAHEMQLAVRRIVQMLGIGSTPAANSELDPEQTEPESHAWTDAQETNPRIVGGVVPVRKRAERRDRRRRVLPFVGFAVIAAATIGVFAAEDSLRLRSEVPSPSTPTARNPSSRPDDTSRREAVRRSAVPDAQAAVGSILEPKTRAARRRAPSGLSGAENRHTRHLPGATVEPGASSTVGTSAPTEPRSEIARSELVHTAPSSVGLEPDLLDQRE